MEEAESLGWGGMMELVAFRNALSIVEGEAVGGSAAEGVEGMLREHSPSSDSKLKGEAIGWARRLGAGEEAG